MPIGDYDFPMTPPATGVPARPLRLFVAIHAPAEHARRMLELLGPRRLPAHRTTPVEQVHITVHFIGDVQRRELEDTIESVERSASGLPAFTLEPRRLITLPERGPPRLVALETDVPSALLELHRRLVHRLARPARGGGKQRDRFLPHFTLCRFAHDARAQRLDEPVMLEPVAVDHVSLMSSVLRPEGAQHQEVGRWTLEAR